MSSSPSTPPETSSEPPASLIVRHRVHELRNSLNGLDLHAQLLSELLQDKETLDIVAHMRRQIEDMESSIKWLSLQFTDPVPDIVVAQDLIVLWQQQLKRFTQDHRKVEWSVDLASQAVQADPRATVAALRELTTEAWKKPLGHPLQADARVDAAHIQFTLSVPGTTVPTLGGTLAEVRRVLIRNGASFDLAPIPEGSGWIATIRFPIAR